MCTRMRLLRTYRFATRCTRAAGVRRAASARADELARAAFAVEQTRIGRLANKRRWRVG